MDKFNTFIKEMVFGGNLLYFRSLCGGGEFSVIRNELEVSKRGGGEGEESAVDGNQNITVL